MLFNIPKILKKLKLSKIRTDQLSKYCNEYIDIRNLEFASIDKVTLKLDLYLPSKEYDCPLPLIVWIHGGDWRGFDWEYGDKYPCPAARMAGRGYAVASLNYRLGKFATFPAQLKDCKSAIKWLRTNSIKYNINKNNIGIWGASGGATLAMLLGSTNGDLESRDSKTGGSSEYIKAVVDCFGPVLFSELDEDYYLDDRPGSVHHNIPGSSYYNWLRDLDNIKQMASASPLAYVTQKSPPALIIHGFEDPVVSISQSLRLFSDLKNVKAKPTLNVVNNAGHGLNSLYADDLIDAFFDKHLMKKKHDKDKMLDKVCITLGPDKYKTYKKQFGINSLFTKDISPLFKGVNLSDWNFPIISENFGSFSNSFYSKEVGGLVSYQIYLPPSYASSKNRRYPVIYFLITPDNNPSWLYNISKRLNNAILSAQSPELIMISVTTHPDGLKPLGIIYNKPLKGDLMFYNDFIPYIDSKYRTIPDRTGRAIEGHCIGGIFALRLAFFKPELFSAVSSFQPQEKPDVFHSYLPTARKAKNMIYNWDIKSRVIGFNDDYMCSVKFLKSLHQRLLDSGFNNCLEIINGTHHGSLRIYDDQIKNPFQFYVDTFNKNKPYTYYNPKSQYAFIKRNIIYSNNNSTKLKLDLYLPKNSVEKSPIVIWIHGSDWRGKLWRNGSKEYCPITYLVDYGYAVASIEYRLSKEAQFPAQIIDCKSSLPWLKENAGKYNLDPSRIAVCGASSGGHLAALMGTTNGKNHFESQNTNIDQIYNIQAVIDCFGPVDFTKLDSMHRKGCYEQRINQNKADSAVSQLLGVPLSKGVDKANAANPISYIDKKAPPFLILHGINDSIVPYNQSCLLYNALVNSGAISYLEIINDAGHGLESLNAEIKIKAFLDKYLKEESRNHIDCLSINNDSIISTTGNLSFNLFKDPLTKETTHTKYKSFYSETICEEISYLIYKPPSYEKEKKLHYPVVYWLHDKDESPRDNILYAFILDQSIKAGVAPEMIVVFINGKARSRYRNTSDQGPIEKIIIKDLISHVDSTYRTKSERKYRAIEGIGMGGEGAARLAFKYPNIFGLVTIIGGELGINNTEDSLGECLIRNLESIKIDMLIRLINIKDVKYNYSCSEELRRLLRKHYIPHEWLVSEISTNDLLISYMDANLDIFKFYSDAFIL